jgi:chaperone required for assembly of F1-ATPase
MKRFWKDVSIDQTEGGWRVLLDGRPVRTQGGAAQIVPNRTLADLLAAEWAAQQEEIDPATFLGRDLADYAIDSVGTDREAAIATMLRYGETDTLCYRADPDEPLFPRQIKIWEPLLTRVEADHGLQFERVSGILHRAQPPETLNRLRALLHLHNDYTLAAVGTLASLAASLSIALLALEPDADADMLWAAANLEEDWQVEQWGRDAAAEERRTRRLGEFRFAMLFAQASLSR